MFEEEIKKKSTNIVPYLVFFATLIVIFPSILSVLFPALIVSQTSSFHNESIDPFEIGGLATPLIITSVSVLGFGLLYYSKNLPNSIHRAIKFILNFELSRKHSFLVLLTLITVYVGFSIEEFTKPEEWNDWIEIIQPIMKGWPFDIQVPKSLPADAGISMNHVTYFFLYASEKIFQNMRIIPFMASISLLFLTYFFTIEIAKKRVAGLVSGSILLQSFTFLKFDSSAAYSNFWILFYLLSLYLIIKKWQFSFLAYVASIFSKFLPILFLPSTLFFIIFLVPLVCGLFILSKRDYKL